MFNQAIAFVCILAGAYCLEQADKDAILDLHNKFRRATAKGETVDSKGKVQDKAADMTELIWDDAAEAAARSWVDTCPKPGAHGHEDQYEFGENIAWGSPPSSYTFERLVELWYEEVTVKPGQLFGKPDKFQMNMISKGVGHYTTMMYSKSMKLGCAEKECTMELGGNIDGEPIYNPGEPCSQCAPDQTCNDALCVGTPWLCGEADPDYCESDYTTDDCNDGFVIGDCPHLCGQC